MHRMPETLLLANSMATNDFGTQTNRFIDYEVKRNANKSQIGAFI